MSENILTYFEQIKAQGLSIDITRGKPDAYQLDLANELLSMNIEPFDGDVDLRIMESLMVSKMLEFLVQTFCQLLLIMLLQVSNLV